MKKMIMKIHSIYFVSILFLFSFFLVFLTHPRLVEAKSVIVNSNTAPQLAAWPFPNEGIYRGAVALEAGISATVEYKADISSKKTYLSDGSTVQVGDILYLAPSLGTISWNITGGVYDTPYGYWMTNASVPWNSCNAGDYLTVDQGTFSRSYYFRFSVSPPVFSKTISGEGKLLCFNILGANNLCRVMSPGNININFIYPATFAKLYATHGSCLNTTYPLMAAPFSSAYQFSIPNTQINFNFTAVASSPQNQIPSVSIEVPPETYVGDNTSISFTATDDDGDDVKVAIDWDNSGEISQWLPSSNNYVSSGEKQETTRSWSETGTKTFRAKAVDEHGAESGWVSASILVKEKCGNGQIDTGEVCDGSNLGGQSCSTLNGSSFTGTISCNSTCSGFVQNCTNNTNNPNYCPAEGGTRSCSTGLLGVCSSGQQTCTGNTWGTCIQLFSSNNNEICGNGLDDNCDGQTDENCSVNNPPPVTPICNKNKQCERSKGENFFNCSDCRGILKEF